MPRQFVELGPLNWPGGLSKETTAGEVAMMMRKLEGEGTDKKPCCIHGSELQDSSEHENEEVGGWALKVHWPIGNEDKDDCGEASEWPFTEDFGWVISRHGVTVGCSLPVDDAPLHGEGGDHLVQGESFSSIHPS